MNILVANLGSTSFKYSLFDGSEHRFELLTKGGYERVTDYAECILDALTEMEKSGFIENGDAIDAVGFKTVLGTNLTGCGRSR